MGSQVRQMRPGQDEIAGVIDDQRQVALAGGGIPADEPVAGSGLPGRGAEAQQGQQEAVGRVHEVPQLGARQRFVAKVVVALDVLVPEPAAGVGGPQQGEAQGAGCGQREGAGVPAAADRCAGKAAAAWGARKAARAAAG